VDTGQHQDGIIHNPTLASPISLSNKFSALADAVDEAEEPTDPDDVSKTTPSESSSIPAVLPDKPATKFWHYEVVPPAASAGDRSNDGPKSKAFFNDLPARRVPRTNSTPLSDSTANLAHSPELQVLLSCMESNVSPDVCLLTSARTSDLHSAFGTVFFYGPDPKSQRDIDQLSPQHAQRYNDATIAEFQGMKKKDVMILVPRSAFPTNTVIYPSVVN
jgi:hypothetical protein